MFRRVLGAAVALIALSATASAQDAPLWQIRGRGLLILPQASSTPNGLDVKANAVAEIDITRYFGRNFAFELVLGTSSHEVTSTTGNTTTSLGSAAILPPTLTLQYRFLPEGKVQPYVGAGGNMTIFYDKTGSLAALDLSTSIGYAFQGGADIALGGSAWFNLDVKYVGLNTDVKSGSTKAYDLKINPLLIAVGVGIRL